MKEAPCRARCCPRGRPGIGGRDHGELSPPFAGKLRLRNDRDCHLYDRCIDPATNRGISLSSICPHAAPSPILKSAVSALAAGDHFDHTAQLQSPLRTILTVGMDGTSSSSRLPGIPFLSRIPHVSPSFYSSLFVNRSARVMMHLRSRHSRQLWRRGGW